MMKLFMHIIYFIPTLGSLLNVADYAYDKLEKNQKRCLFLNLTKTVDTENHSILLYKLYKVEYILEQLV